MNNTIEGGGTIDNLSNFTNTGTIEATGGGTLEIYGLRPSRTREGRSRPMATSDLILYDATVDGGSLAAAGNAVIHSEDRTQLNGVTITQGTTLSVDDYTYLNGDLTNEGTIIVGSTQPTVAQRLGRQPLWWRYNHPRRRFRDHCDLRLGLPDQRGQHDPGPGRY